MINFKDMMAQAQQMQFKLAELQEKFADIEVEGEAGGGAVVARMNCKGDMLGLTLGETLIADTDKETLEDLIVAAINTAAKAKDARVEAETKAMMAEMGLPEDTQLPI